MKQNYGKKAIFCYMDTNSFIVCIKTEDSYVDTTKDVETRFSNSNYELETPLPKAKKNWINQI